MQLKSFETFMESYDEELNRDELELFAEMTDSYAELADIIQEGKILDAATGKGKDENLLIKIIKFIPRLVKAVVKAIKNKINKNKNRIKELEDEVRQLKTDLDDANIKLTVADKKVNTFQYLKDISDKNRLEAEKKYKALKAESDKREALIKRLSKFETDLNPDKLLLMSKNLDILEKLPVNLNNKFTAFLKEVIDSTTEEVSGIKEIFYKYFDKFHEKYDYKQETKVSVIDYLDALFDNYNRFCDIIERINKAADDIHFDYDTLESKGITGEQATCIRIIISDYFKEINSSWTLCSTLIIIDSPHIDHPDISKI